MAGCTKLVQWLSLVGVLGAVWYALLAGLAPLQLSNELYEVILPLPVYLLICFGCYSLSVVGYRVMTFNDCKQASSQLMMEIQEAKKDLRSKGMKL